MNRITTILLFLSSLPLVAQHLVMKDGANMVFSSATEMVLKDISLTNEGLMDAEDGTLSFSTSSEVDLSTTSETTIQNLIMEGPGGFLNVDGELVVNTVELSANNNLTLLSNSKMRIKDDLTTTGNFVVESAASLIIRNAATVSGDITLYRNTTFDANTGKYSVVGSPVSDALFSTLGSAAQDWIFEYDETEAYSADGSARFMSPGGSFMEEGKGYFSAFTGDENGTIIFSGAPNYTNTSIGVTKTDHPTAEDNYEGFNLVANPFTCPLSFTEFVSANSSLLAEESIWIWDDIASDAGGGDVSADYMTINAMGSTDSQGGRLSAWDGTINVAQGFFIKTNASGNIDFTQAMKTHDGNDDESFFRNEELSVEKYWLSIQSESGAIGANTLIGFHPEASDAFDAKFDASKFGKSLSVYSLIEDQRFAIQGLSENWISQVYEGKQIGIGYQVLEDGEYTIAIQKSEVPSEVPLYLNDLVNGTYHDLTEEKGYSFSSASGSFDSRFVLSLAPLSVGEIIANNDFLENLIIYGASRTIKLEAIEEGRVSVISVDGKLISQQDFSRGKTRLSVPSIGVYLVTVVTINSSSTQKVVVN